MRHITLDVRMHDSPTIHSHPHSLPTHINGSAVALPSTPGGMSNGSIVSPAVPPNTVPNGVVSSPSSMIHKLAVANEQTWLLIGTLSMSVLALASNFFFRSSC